MKSKYRFYRTYILCALAFVFMIGCSGKLSDTAKLHNHISIDGVDVSAKKVGEARALLQSAADRRLAETKIDLLLPVQTVTLTAAELGISLDIESALKEAAALERNGGDRILTMRYTVDKGVMQDMLSRFAALYSTAATDASVTIDASIAIPVVYTAEQQGIQIREDELGRLITTVVENGSFSPVTVPYSTVEPAVTLTSIQARQQLVAQFATSFEGSTLSNANRVFNIEKGAEMINGIVLQPGEEFDCNEMLGDRTAENGWREAPGIRNGRYENEYSGGVCQISSTLFNAVMMADLEVLERSPHSWPMGYVDIGCDATISTGGKNFRFVNSSAAPLYIFMHVDEELQTLTASLYGAPLEDGMYIVVNSEKTGTLESAGEELMLDETLPYNTKVVMREARDGKTAKTYKEYYSRDGELIRREVVYEDTYRAIDGLTYVSTDLYYDQ